MLPTVYVGLRGDRALNDEIQEDVMSKLVRSTVVLVGAIALSLVLVFVARPSAVLADDQPDGSTIDSDQDVHGTWGPGTITATADVTIQSGVVITVAPNTTVVVADGVGFTINGDMHSDGPAVFTSASATPGAWQGITYGPGSSGTLDQVTVEYAQHALTLNTTNQVTIAHSVLRYNRHAPASGQDAYGAGLLILAGDHLIEYTDIHSSVAWGTGSGAEAYGGGVDIQAGSSQILNSQIYDNQTRAVNSSGGGGGIVIRGGSAPLIQYCEVTTNTLTTASGLGSGGGIAVLGTTQAVIRDSLIAGNTNTASTWAGGGGIGFGSSARATLIDSNVIANNQANGSAWGEGGAIDSWENNAFVVSNNLMINNSTSSIGGAVNINGNVGAGNVNVINNTIIGNTANQGGGIYRQSNGVVYNNIVVGNTATNTGGGVYGSSGSGDYNDVWGNLPNNYNGGAPAHDLQIDPKFLGIGDLAQRYHLSPCSPLIDAGTDPGSGFASTDYDGESRPQRVTWDIGLDEVGPSVGTYVCKSALTTGPVAPGQSVTFTVKFGNLSSSTATDIVLTDTIPSGMIDPDYTNSGATITPIPGETFAWDVQDLAQGEGGVITITGIVGLDLFGGSVDNIAEIESSIGYNAAGASVSVCDTIQCMIDAADPGDTVVVPAGLHVESLNLTKPVSLTGVSSATVVVQAPASNRVMYIDGSDITNDVLISGMTFTGGNVTGNGGGIYITNGAQPRFEDVIISGNTARYRGGGIYMDSVSASLFIDGSVITGNETTYNDTNARGGGIYLVGAGNVLVVTDSTISDNTAEQYGGAVFYDSPTGLGSISITDSDISDNEATRVHGGGIYAARAAITVTNSTISGNQAPSADRAGGGIHLRGAGSSLTVDSSTFSNNVASRQGGAIYAYDDNIQIRILNGSVFTGNETTEDDNYSQGGGIYLYGTGTELAIADSVLSSNVSERYGGAIYVYAGNDTSQVSLSNTEIIDNEATDLQGGGAYIYRATTRIENSLISGNTANGSGADGGGLYLSYTPAVISNTTVYSNSASDDGGGIYGYYGSLTLVQSTVANNRTGDDGGGIYQYYGSLMLANSTVSGNSTTVSTDGDGGGVNTYSSTADFYNTTIFDNSAIRYGGGLQRQSSGNVRFYNSIVAGNSAGTSGENCSGSIATGSNNLASDASCPVGGGFSIDPDSALLGSLSDNGGETPTHLILPGNPAVEGGDNGICAAAPVNGVDQRGVVRPQGANCDVGSVEVPASLVVTKSGSNEDGDPLRPGETILYTILLSNSSALANTGVVVTDTFPAHTTYVPDSLNITPPSAGGTPGTQPVLVEDLTVDADSEVVVTYEVSVSIPLTDGVVIENTAIASSVEVPYPASSTVSDTVVATPAVKVVKEGWDVADVGDTVVYTFTVTNVGDTLLHNLAVDDDVAGLATLVSGDDGDGWLDLTEAWVYRATYTIQPTDPDPVDNTVTVTAFDAVGTETSDSDDHSTAIVYNPVLSIAKDGPDTADVGDLVRYTFTVSHDPSSDGSPISSVAVDDTIASAATYDSGDDGDSLLEMGESWIYTADYTIQPTDPDPLVNGATVAGRDPEGDDVSAQASHSLDVEYAPALSIEKLGQSSADVGETVLFFFLVGNDTTNGDGSPISNVTVTDDVAGLATLIGSDTVLEGGEVWIYMATYTIQATDPSPLVNVGTVEGVDRDGDLVSNTADHTTTLRDYEPALSIIKDGPESAPMGATVVYSFTVTNDDVNGDGAPVGSLTVSDDVAGAATYVEGDDGDGYLSVGESWTYTASYTIRLSDPSPLVNTGTVEGQDPEGDTVTASGEHSTIIDYIPGIEISKTPDTQTTAQGADATFTITISNTGDSPLEVEVTDPQSPACSRVIGTLVAGEDYEYTCSATGVTGDFVNSATAVGSPPTGDDVTAMDTAIVDVLPTVALAKSADPSRVNEPGGTVTFTVRVENTSEEAVTLNSLVDDPHGDLNGQGTCSVPQTIAVGEAYECEFSVLITGDVGDSETDTVTASVSDDEANTVDAADSATVDIVNVPPPVMLVKIADPTEVAEPGGDVTFTVRVENVSVADSLTIDSLVDDVHSDLGTCTVPQTIAMGEAYECTFSAFVGGDVGDSETDTVTASGSDDDGNDISISDSATVDVVDAPSSIMVTKTADPAEVAEPGGDVTFTVRVENTSAVDSVTIDSLVDDTYGDLNSQGTCAVPQTIPAGGSYECAFSAFIAGEAGDSETDVVTASGTDDDTNPVSAQGSVTVDVIDVPSSIVVTKTADPAEVAEPGGHVTFTVRVDNTSAVDSVTIESLTDDVHGNLEGRGTCAVLQTIAAGGFYECEFGTFVGGNAGESETDTVTASGTDDDANPVSAFGSAAVDITDVPSSLAVSASAAPPLVAEPGANVIVIVELENTSAVDIVTVDSLADDLLGDLNGQGSCSLPRVIAPGASYECHYSAFVGGNAGDSVTDNVAASGSDDDGQPVSAQGEATVIVTDRSSSIRVSKTPDPTSVPETGDTVTFTVRVENTSAADSVTIDSLVDDTYGDLDGQGTCAVPQTIAAGEAYECEFGGFVSGDAGESAIDVITASGVDDDGNAISASAEASVTITDVPSSLSVIKTADPSEVAEPGRDVTFTVRIENTSAVDSVTVKSLVDDVHGDLDEEGTCSVPQTIAAGEFYECTFSAFVGGDVGESEMDTVTASGTDDDDQPVSAQGSVTVSVVDSPGSIAVIKSADPSSVPEPGGDVVFTVRIENTSAADSVTVESLVDDLRGDLNGQGTCAVPQTIPAGAWYECQFSALVSGSPGDSETDVVTVSGTDSDGADVEGQGSATVMIEDVLPTILVTAAADPLVIRSGDLVDFAIQVHNTSVEPITVTSISDSIQGDLSSECALPASVADGDFFECIVSHAINFDHTNIVSATVADDEGNVVSGSAEAPVDVIGPAVRITGHASADTAELGEAITYTCQVENVGDVTLADIVATDNRLGSVSLISTTLEPGEITVGNVVYEVVEADLPGPLVYTVTVTAKPPVGEEVSDTDTVVVNLVQPAPPMRYVYLPLMVRSLAPIEYMAPDLVVDSISLTTDNVEIVIKNQGYAPVVHTFWVDLYIDPDPVPTGVNQTWEKLCDEGIVWGVLGLDGDLPLAPGDAITLTLNDAYYCVPGAVCNFSGSFREGSQIYVQVDSADERTDYGAVLETHEMAGEAYNNISGPVTPGAADLEPPTQLSAGERRTVTAHNLPPR